MEWTHITLLSLVGLWLLANLKTSRPDGTLVPRVHPYRHLMQYIMPTRNESLVYFDSYVYAERIEAYLEKAGPKLGANMIHVFIGALNVAFGFHPHMNRFVAGKRLYDRDGRWFSFSMKRKKMGKKAKLSAVKMQMKDGESFAELVERINGSITHERSGTKTAADKEYDLFKVLPRPLLAGAAKFLRWLDYYGLLPGFFIKGDGMYTTCFVANLGSLGIAPAYHHLYEWGNCPIFMMVGKIDDKPVIEDGEVVVRRVLHLRISLDERVADALAAHDGTKTAIEILQNPEQWLGCITEDGSDVFPMWPREDDTPCPGDNAKLAVC